MCASEFYPLNSQSLSLTKQHGPQSQSRSSILREREREGEREGHSCNLVARLCRGAGVYGHTDKPDTDSGVALMRRGGQCASCPASKQASKRAQASSKSSIPPDVTSTPKPQQLKSTPAAFQFPKFRSYSLHTCGTFRKLGVPYVGVLIIRILLFRVLYYIRPPIFGNPHM